MNIPFTEEELEVLELELMMDDAFNADRVAELAGWPPDDMYWDAVSEGLYVPRML